MVEWDSGESEQAAQGRAGPAQLAPKAEEDRYSSFLFAQFFLDHAADPSFWIGEDGRYLYANEAACRSLGYSREELLGKSVLDIDPDLSAGNWSEHWQRTRRQGATTLQARHRRKSGEVFPVEVTVTHLEFRGREYHCTFARDISDRLAAEEALRKSKDYLQSVIDAIADPILVIDREFRVVLANRVAREHAGGIDPVAMGMSCHQLSHHPEAPCASVEEWCPLRQVISTARPATVTHTHKDADGRERIFEVTGWPVFDEDGRVLQMIEYCREVTERKKAERSIAHLNTVLRAARMVDQLIGQEKDRVKLLQGTCESLIQTGGYNNAWIALTDEAGKIALVAQAGMDREFLANLQRAGGCLPQCLSKALEQPGVVTVADPVTTCPDCSQVEIYRGSGAMCVRLECGGKVYGLFAVSVPRDLMGNPGEPDLFGEVAADVATALHDIEMAEQRRRIEAELAQARQREAEIGFRIQQMLLLGQVPQDMPGLAVAAITVPSQQIDGDFYDFFRHGEQCLDIVVGDVMGKGVPAALLGAVTKSHFQRAVSSLMGLAHSSELPSPRQIVRRVHDGLTRQLISLESFVTLCYARLDLEKQRMEFVDCGHTQTIHYRAKDGQCQTLHGSNLFLGVMEECNYQQVSVPIAPGDVLLFYSDGVVEARNEKGEFFGPPRLGELVRANAQRGPQALLDEVLKAVVAFSNSDVFADDLTCVAVQVRQVPAPPLAHLEMLVFSSLSELARLREFVRSACTKYARGAMDEEGTVKLELAVNEAAANIMKHAYRHERDQTIHAQADVLADRVVIRLYHQGEAMDHRRATPEGLDFSRDGGFGLYIIRHAVDDVSYTRQDDGGNCICLTKNFPPPADRRKPNGNDR